MRVGEEELIKIKEYAVIKGQNLSGYLISCGLKGGSVFEESADEKQLKELIDFVGLSNLLDKLHDITKSRDVKKWGWLLMERLSGPAIQVTGVSSEKLTDNKWEGWEILPNPDGESIPYYSESYQDNVIVVGKGIKSQIIKEGEDGWDYFINQLQ